MKTRVAFPARGGEAFAAGSATHSSHALAAEEPSSRGAPLALTSERRDDTPRYSTPAHGSAGRAAAESPGVGSIAGSARGGRRAAAGFFPLLPEVARVSPASGVLGLERPDPRASAPEEFWGVSPERAVTFLQTCFFLRLSHLQGVRASRRREVIASSVLFADAVGKPRSGANGRVAGGCAPTSFQITNAKRAHSFIGRLRAVLTSRDSHTNWIKFMLFNSTQQTISRGKHANTTTLSARSMGAPCLPGGLLRDTPRAGFAIVGSAAASAGGGDGRLSPAHARHRSPGGSVRAPESLPDYGAHAPSSPQGEAPSQSAAAGEPNEAATVVHLGLRGPAAGALG